jgi:hypothetical protein
MIPDPLYHHAEELIAADSSAAWKNANLKPTRPTGIPESLIRAVVEQFGGWEDFEDSAGDVARHGIDGGFGGWCYYRETMPFATANRADIRALARSYAEEFGQDLITMISGWRCVEGATADEIGEAVYGSGEDSTVLNGLAWFAAEEVCRAYVDAVGGE